MRRNYLVFASSSVYLHNGSPESICLPKNRQNKSGSNPLTLHWIRHTWNTSIKNLKDTNVNILAKCSEEFLSNIWFQETGIFQTKGFYTFFGLPIRNCHGIWTPFDGKTYHASSSFSSSSQFLLVRELSCSQLYVSWKCRSLLQRFRKRKKASHLQSKFWIPFPGESSLHQRFTALYCSQISVSRNCHEWWLERWK